MTSTSSTQTLRRPRYSVKERDDNYAIDVYLPGSRKEEIEISIENGELNISAKRNTEIDESWTLLRHETGDHDYHLRLSLNVEIDESKVDAKVENGVLQLSLPKAVEAKTRKIKVH